MPLKRGTPRPWSQCTAQDATCLRQPIYINIHNNYGEETPLHVKQPPQTAFQLTVELVDNSHNEAMNGNVY